MGNHQRHRGMKSEDEKWFADDQLDSLRMAVADYNWMLSRGYSDGTATLSLVGDRYRLPLRQRHALMRAACSDASLILRKEKEIAPDQLQGKPLWIDGYNLLITLESGLSGGIVLRCRDGSWRDIASLHGTYRQVEETSMALEMTGKALLALEIPEVTWFLDAPVSNSGRLRQMMKGVAEYFHFPWQIHIVNSPDKQLAEVAGTVVTSDGWIMERAPAWVNLSQHVLGENEALQLIDLSLDPV